VTHSTVGALPWRQTMRSIGLMFLVVMLWGAGCGGSSPPDAGYDVSLRPYYEPCTLEPDSCPAPYVCTEVVFEHGQDGGAVSDRCLLPCDSASDCPGTCCCRDTECISDTGKDGFCVCP
jgi:hypothetical protein